MLRTPVALLQLACNKLMRYDEAGACRFLCVRQRKRHFEQRGAQPALLTTFRPPRTGPVDRSTVTAEHTSISGSFRMEPGCTAPYGQLAHGAVDELLAAMKSPGKAGTGLLTALSRALASAGKWRSSGARFSARWETSRLPTIRWIAGSSAMVQASATCKEVTPASTSFGRSSRTGTGTPPSPRSGPISWPATRPPPQRRSAPTNGAAWSPRRRRLPPRGIADLTGRTGLLPRLHTHTALRRPTNAGRHVDVHLDEHRLPQPLI